jgi:pSer/pThr/pTyr-binding forkhead associated (FHA) protein
MLTIGRLKENDIVIDNLSVSRLHARILLEGERVFLEDQGSGNGCVVNGRRVDRAPIGPGDAIHIGKHELVVLAPGEELEIPDGAASKPVGQADHSPWDGAHTYFLPQDEDGPPKEEVVERHAGLILQHRGEFDRVVSVDRTPFVIGRAPECDLVLAESGVSREHARILQDGDDFVLEDLGGVNGTFLGGERAERRVLEIGDEIVLDVYQITFVLEDRPIAEEIHVAPALSGMRGGRPTETFLAETQPPGGSLSPAESTLIGGQPEAGAGEPIAALAPAEACTSERLSLELEVEPEALPEPLRTALLDACDGGLTLPVTLRLRRS